MPTDVSYSEEMLERHGYLSWLGIAIESAEPGRVVLSLPLDEKFTNPGSDAVHGGVTATLIDNAAGSAARTTMDEPETTPHATTSLDVSYVRPAGSDLRAEAVVDRVAGGVGVVRVEVTSVAPDGERKVVATGQVTFHVGEPTDGGGEGAGERE